MTKNRMRSVGLAGMFSLGVSACGAPEFGQTEGQENVAEEESAVLPGARDLTFNIFPQSQTFESETDAATSTSGATYVGYITSYNPGPEALITYVPNTVNGVTVEDRIVCAGASQAGYTSRFASGQVASKSRMLPPPGTAVLWGDPALTNVGNTIFYSNLSIPNTRFQSKVNFNGCMRFSDLDPRYYKSMGAADAVRGACIGKATVNQGVPGGFASTQFTCFGNQFFLDGGSMTHTTGFAYAAYRNTFNNTALVMKGAPAPGQQFVEIPASPVTGVIGHPVLTANGNVIWMLAPTSTGLKLAGYSETTNTWSAVTTIATDHSLANVVLRNGTQIRSRGGHTITTIANPPAPARMNIFYHKKSGNFMRVQGVSCGFGSDLVVGCGPVAKWVTPSTDNAFIPQAAQVSRQVAGALFASFRHFVSYYSDEGQPTGGVRVRFAEVTSTNAFTPTFDPGGGVQAPCVIPPDYWGDYDVMYSRNNGGANWGTLARTVTDSSQHQCDKRAFRAFPQHVSEVTFTPN